MHVAGERTTIVELELTKSELQSVIDGSELWERSDDHKDGAYWVRVFLKSDVDAKKTKT